MGDDFVRQLETAFDSIRLMPAAWPPFGPLTRRFILSRFPYCVVYKTYAGDCLVVAVMHQSQKPGYWKKRR